MAFSNFILVIVITNMEIEKKNTKSIINSVYTVPQTFFFLFVLKTNLSILKWNELLL